MTQTEALRLALEALETSMYPQQKQLQAITAIKAALEAKDEPPRFPTMLRKMWSGTEVQDWVNENWLAPPQHEEKSEPVALKMDVIVVNLVREGINKHRARELAEHFIKNTTTPPQRKPLTDEEINALDYSGTRIEFVRAIEAKLKEKNGI